MSKQAITTNPSAGNPPEAPPAGAAEAPPAGETPPAGEQTDTPDPDADPDPDGLDQLLAEAGDDPAKLKELIKKASEDNVAAKAQLSKVNAESKARRLELNKLNQRLADLEKAETERKRSGMSELERLQDENKELAERIAGLESENADNRARAQFLELGAVDVDSVQALWKITPEAERKQTTPEAWAEELKKAKPHLFKSAQPVKPGFGSNPNKERPPAGGDGTPTFNTHPTDPKEIKQMRQAFRQMFRK